MGLLLIWDDLHASGGRSKRAREQYNKRVEKNWHTENWSLKLKDALIEKEIKTKHQVLVKLEKNGMTLKNASSYKDLKVSLG